MPDYMCQVVTPLQLGVAISPEQLSRSELCSFHSSWDSIRIGFNPQLVTLQVARGNMFSAEEQAEAEAEVIDKYLWEELAANWVVRIRDADAGLIHCSPFGVIPK